MAKKTISFADFEADDDIFDSSVEDVTEEENEESQEDEPDEVEEPKRKVKKKVEPQEEEEEVEEEEEPEPPKKVIKKKEEPKEEEPEEATGNSEEDEDQGDSVDAQAFFEEVQKITGQEVKVDYGDIDPLSPQGVALREKAVREDSLNTFLTEIEDKFPQAFRALQHAYNGGDISELFTQTTGRDYTKVELKEGDDTLAKEILREYYKSRGVKNEAKITKLIETDEESDVGLIKEAQRAVDELKQEQEEQRNKVLEVQQAKAAEQKKRDNLLVAAVDEVLETRKLGGFRIPDRVEATEFKKFVFQNIRKTQDGKYELATLIDQNNMEKVLQYQYFQFKKGDLSKMIQQKASTTNADKLRLRLKAEQTKTKKSTQFETTSKFSMKDFEAE